MESRCTWHESVAYCFFFFNDTATTEIYTLSLHDALPISLAGKPLGNLRGSQRAAAIARHHQITGRDGLDGPLRPVRQRRSEEHTSELQSPCNLVCRLLLEKKKSDRTTAE